MAPPGRAVEELLVDDPLAAVTSEAFLRTDDGATLAVEERPHIFPISLSDRDSVSLFTRVYSFSFSYHEKKR